MALLDINESTILDILAEAWNQFTELDVIHPQHSEDFCRAIHEAQRIVMCRPVSREARIDSKGNDEGEQ